LPSRLQHHDEGARQNRPRNRNRPAKDENSIPVTDGEFCSEIL